MVVLESRTGFEDENEDDDEDEKASLDFKTRSKPIFQIETLPCKTWLKISSNTCATNGGRLRIPKRLTPLC